MKLLVDMNLSPLWVPLLRQSGIEAVHWSEVGDPRSTDAEIMRLAYQQKWVVFTHDLDFGTILAHTQSDGPSVLQVRTHDISPELLGSLVIRVLHQFKSELELGALITIDEARQRVRLLPLK